MSYISIKLKIASESVVDGKIGQTRKISFQLIAAKQKMDEMRLFCNAQLWILGINATGPLHQGREIIIDVLKNDGSVRVLLLDPIHEIFDDRSLAEHDSVGRISAELLASLYILLDILYQVRGTQGAAERLELGFHHGPPDKSFIMVGL